MGQDEMQCFLRFDVSRVAGFEVLCLDKFDFGRTDIQASRSRAWVTCCYARGYEV